METLSDSKWGSYAFISGCESEIELSSHTICLSTSIIARLQCILQHPSQILKDRKLGESFSLKNVTSTIPVIVWNNKDCHLSRVTKPEPTKVSLVCCSWISHQLGDLRIDDEYFWMTILGQIVFYKAAWKNATILVQDYVV